jgi:hypothetical protein
MIGGAVMAGLMLPLSRDLRSPADAIVGSLPDLHGSGMSPNPAP